MDLASPAVSQTSVYANRLKGNFECSVTQLVDWIGHNLCRNYFLKHLIEGKVKGKLRRGRSLKLLLDGRKERKRYWNWRQEALDRTLALEGAMDLS